MLDQDNSPRLTPSYHRPYARHGLTSLIAALETRPSYLSLLPKIDMPPEGGPIEY